MELQVTAIGSNRLPSRIVDWLFETLQADYGWIPVRAASYNREFRLNEVVRDLLLEASTKPENQLFSELCAVRAYSQNPADIVLSRFKKQKAPKEKFVRVDRHVYARYNVQGALLSHVVEIQNQAATGRKQAIRRHVPGPIENAISYRDRLEAVLYGPNPEDYIKVPLLTP